MPISTQRVLRTAALAALTLLLSLLLLLALPPVQIHLARAIASNLDGINFEVDYLWVSPRGVDLSGLRLETPQLALGVEEAHVDLATWSSLASLGLDIEDATLRGVDLRLASSARQPASAEPAQPASAPFAGIEPLAKIPGWLRLRKLSASGRVSAHPQPEIEVTGPWTLSLDSLAADSTAMTRLTGTFDAQRENEIVASGTIDANLSAAIDASSAITQIRVDTDIEPLDTARGIRLAATVTLDDAVERYALEINDAAGARLAQLDATLGPSSVLQANWEAGLTPGILAAFARGRSLADLSGSSSGTVRADLANRRAQIESSTAIEGRGWEAFDPRLAELGSLNMNIEIKAAIEPGAVDAETLQLVIRSAAVGDLLSVAALQRLRFESGDKLFSPERWGEPALRLRASAIPLRWLRGFSPRDIEGGTLSGAIDVVRDDERLTRFVTEQPLAATGIQIAPVRGMPVPVFDVLLEPRATMRDGTLDAAIEKLTITAATGLNVEFQGSVQTSLAKWPVADFDGRTAMHIPALQRIIPQLNALHATTRLQFDFSALALTIAVAAIGADSVNGRELLSVDLSGRQPLRVLLPDFTPDWDGFEPQSLSLQLTRVPLDWLSPYLPELEFRGGEVSGRFTAVARVGEGIRLETNEPLTIDNLIPAYRGQAAQEPWSATVRPQVLLSNTLSSFALEDLRIRTPSGNEIDASMRVEAPANTDRIAISIALDADLAPLARRYGAQLGALHWRQRGELEPASHRLTLDELEVTFADSAGTKFVEINNLRPFMVMSQPFSVAVDSGSTEILRATVTPLRLQGLVPKILGFDLEGVLPQGEFFASAEPGGRLVLAAAEPLLFRDVTVRWGDATLLDRVSMGAEYEVAYSAGGLEARSVDLTATAPDGATLLHTTVEAVAPLTDKRLLNRARITLEANLPPLAQQPVLADLPPFTAGTLESSFELSSDSETSTVLKAELKDAATKRLGPLPNLRLQLDASGVRGDHVAVALPLHLESAENGSSDLLFDGTVAKDADGVLTFDAALTGKRIAMTDVERLLALLAPAQADAVENNQSTQARSLQERASAIQKLRSERHSVPVWTNHLRGTASVDVGSIALPSFSIEGLRGRLDLTPERAELTDLRASVLGADLRAAAAVDFDAAAAKPYALDFRAGVDNLEVGRLFLAVAPNDTPTAEGHFDFDTTLNGTGLNPIDLGLSALGEIRLVGRNGVFRGLAAGAGTGSTAAKVLGFLTFSKELKAVGRLLDGLGEMQFEQAEFLLSRTATDSLDLRTLFLRSPQLQLSAAGSLALAPARPLLLSPLDVSAQLAARRDVAILFDGMKLLQDQADDAGYRKLTQPIAIGGSPAEPDASALWELLDEGANNARGSFGATLRALNRQLERSGSATE